MLKSYVEFKSSLFPPCSENPEEWEGAIWGRALAQFLDEKLKQQHQINALQVLIQKWRDNPHLYTDLNIWECIARIEQATRGEA